jgi:hypothetical protein
LIGKDNAPASGTEADDRGTLSSRRPPPPARLRRSYLKDCVRARPKLISPLSIRML